MSPSDIYGNEAVSKDGNPARKPVDVRHRREAEAPSEQRKSSSSKSQFRSLHEQKRVRRVILKISLLLMAVYLAGTVYMIARVVINVHRDSGGRRFRFLSALISAAPVERPSDRLMEPDLNNSSVSETIAKLNSTRNVLNTAEVLLDQGIYTQAISRIRQSQDDIYVNADVYYTLARAYWAAKDHDRALHLLLQSLTNDPTDARKRVDLALLLGDMQEYDDMLRAAEWALVIAPNSIAAMDAAAQGYLHSGEYDKAADYVQRILSSDPDNVRAHIVAAVIQYRAGDQSRAILSLRSHIEKGANDPSFYQHLAMFYVGQGMLDQASELMNNAIRRFDENTVRGWLQAPEFQAHLADPRLQPLILRLTGRADALGELITGQTPQRTTSVDAPTLELDQDRLRTSPRR